MKKFKISEIAKLLDIPHSKAKRYVRELLPPDPEATLQSGRARSLTEEDAYLIFLTYHLVSDLNFSVHEAKIIIDDLIDLFLELEVGLFPMKNGQSYKKKSKIKSWRIFIYKTNKPFILNYEIEGVISITQKEKLEGVWGMFGDMPIQQKKFVSFNYPSKREWDNLEKVEDVYRDDLYIRIFKISYLFEIFKLKIRGENIYKKKNFLKWFIHFSDGRPDIEKTLKKYVPHWG